MPELEKKYEEEVEEIKVDMLDLDPLEQPNLSYYTSCQLKFDGWWTLIKIKDQNAQVITSKGVLRAIFPIDSPDIVLNCEWIYGTTWAQKSPLFDKFMIFDCLEFDGWDYKIFPYRKRMEKAGEWLSFIERYFPKFALIDSFPTTDWYHFWKNHVTIDSRQAFEGIVFRNDEDNFYLQKVARMKKEVTMEYVVMDYKEGNGRLQGTLGAVIGGMYVNSILVPICTVGGGYDDSMRDYIWINREKFLGKVFEARGKTLFPSGALRHPAFTRFREDKNPHGCIWRNE